MGFLIPQKIKINLLFFFFLQLICLEKGRFEVTSLGKTLHLWVHQAELTYGKRLLLRLNPSSLKWIGLILHAARQRRPESNHSLMMNGSDEKEVEKKREMLCVPACHELAWTGLFYMKRKVHKWERGKEELSELRCFLSA